MALKRSLASYWNGSAWVEIETADGGSAIVSASMIDIINTPTALFLRIINASPSPLDASVVASRKGPFTGIFTDFMPIRLRDSESNLVWFYGVVYNTKELYEHGLGMVIDLECRDYLLELRDNTTDGGVGYEIDTTDNLYDNVSNLAQSNIDTDTNLWSTSVASRGGIIKSLLANYGKNLSYPTGNSADSRFVESIQKFEENGIYGLGGRSKKSGLSHIIGLAASDPWSLTTSNAAQRHGFTFYADPNFTSTLASHKPTAYFNYFKRAHRPIDSDTSVADGTSLSLALNIDLPSKNFVADGQHQPMQEFEFERPKGEIYTDAVVSYTTQPNTPEGGTSSVETKTTFEVLTVKAISGVSIAAASSVPRWRGLDITEGHLAYDADEGVLFPEWLQVRTVNATGAYTTAAVSGSVSLVTVARMQYISQITSVDAATPAYVLISDVDESIDSSCFAEDAIWYGKTNTSASLTIKSRPRTTYGVRRIMALSYPTTTKSSIIRQAVATALLRRSSQLIRGSFKTVARPQYYYDASPTAVTTNTAAPGDGSTGTDQTIAANLVLIETIWNPATIGVQIGMPVVKLDSSGLPTSQYGYISAMTATTVRLIWNTGTCTTSDTLRYYIPVRAGDLIHLTNNLVDINSVAGNGSFLVTKITYTEQPGIYSTVYEVTGQEKNEEGGFNKKSFAVSTAETAMAALNAGPPETNQSKAPDAVATTVFTHDSQTQVSWTAGNLNIGGKTHTIAVGTTASTMVAAGDGNTGQSGTTLTVTTSPVTDYYIYYPGKGTALKTIKQANYRNVVNTEIDPIIVAFCTAGSASTKKAELGLYVKGTQPIDASMLKAGTITTKVSEDMAGVTMNVAGQIMSGKTAYGSGTGYILEYNGGTPRFDIGSTSEYLRWTGSALEVTGKISGASEITLGGSGIDASGESSGAGKITMHSTDGNARMRLRAFNDAVMLDTLSVPFYFAPTGVGSNIAHDRLGGGTVTWAGPDANVSPFLGHTYLGDVRDSGASPYEWGRGWKALVLQAMATDSVTELNATLVLRAATTTASGGGQYVFDFPPAPPGTNGFVLSSTTTGITSWVAQSTGAVTSIVAGATGISISGATGDVTVTNTGVTSVGTAGTVNGLTLTGTVTTTGNLTLGGTLAINNGDWSGTDLAVTHGGTGQSSLGSVAISAFNNDSGFTSNAGDITSVQLSGSSGSAANITSGAANFTIAAGSNVTTIGNGSNTVTINASNTTYSANAGQYMQMTGTVFGVNITNLIARLDDEYA